MKEGNMVLAMTNAAITNDNQQKVLDALSDPNWDWRTLQGLERSTGLTSKAILEIILENWSKLEFDVSSAHDNVFFRLRDRTSRSLSWTERMLDFLSFGGRNRLHPA